MNKEEATNFFTVIKAEQIKKLTDVGFTKAQAEVLLDMMETKSFGLF